MNRSRFVHAFAGAIQDGVPGRPGTQSALPSEPHLYCKIKRIVLKYKR
jgi:hypothetical protein